MGCLNACVLRATAAFLEPKALPFALVTLAVASRSAHVLYDDLFPLEKRHTMVDCFDAPPDSADAPALTASMAAVL